MSTGTPDPVTIKHETLWLALLAFQQDMPTVPKTKTANVPTKSGGSYKYSYADLAVVSGIATPLLTAHGLLFVSTPSPTADGYELVGRIIHADTGKELTGSLPLNGRGSQEIGSAITYMRRYLMGCLTGIITDDDDDAQSTPEQRTQATKPVQMMSQEQFAAIGEWQSRGTDVDVVFREQFGRDVPKEPTYDDAAKLLEYLHRRELNRN